MAEESRKGERVDDDGNKKLFALLQQDFYQVILMLKGLSFDKFYRHASHFLNLFWIMHPTTYLVGCVIQKRFPEP